MVYGVPLLPPTRLTNVNDSDAKGVKGYLKTLTLDDPSGTVPGWVVVVGETLMAAKWSSQKIKVEWDVGETAAVSEADIQEHSRQLIADASKGSILDTYTPLRMVDTPDIEIEFVDSKEVPVGLGEPGTTVIAPAIANAIYNAVGA